MKLPPGSDAAVGALDRGVLARVDERGTVRFGHCQLDWWIGADDEWHFPAEAREVRQSRDGSAPVVETRTRIPGGEAVQRVFGVGGPNGVVVYEVENASPAPFALALVLHSHFPRTHTIDQSMRIARVAKRPVLVLPRAPFHWATARVGQTVRALITSGKAPSGEFVPIRGRTGIEAAFMLPVSHRTTQRVLLVTAGRYVIEDDPYAVADLDAVQRSWAAHLERGLRLEVPEPLQWHVDVARADLLLVGVPTAKPTAATVVALEDWGFDAEAEAGWRRLGTHARRAASRRAPRPADAWGRVRAYLASSTPAGAFPMGPAGFLSAVREVLVHERGDDIDLLPGFPPDWLGQPVAVHDLPLRSGPCSFAVRWHGARPALIWDAPAGVRLHAPALDPMWSAEGGAGEALLAEPPPQLLAMGTRSTEGEPIESPESFG